MRRVNKNKLMSSTAAFASSALPSSSNPSDSRRQKALADYASTVQEYNDKEVRLKECIPGLNILYFSAILFKRSRTAVPEKRG